MKKKTKKNSNKKSSKKEPTQKPYWSPSTFDQIRENLGLNDGPIGNTD